MDNDGYPTEETLKTIREWDVPGDPYGLAKYLVNIWHYPEYIKLHGRYLQIHTGGWSGHEDIMAELHKNLFYSFWWTRAERGGHYWFKLPDKKTYFKNHAK